MLGHLIQSFYYVFLAMIKKIAIIIFRFLHYFLITNNTQKSTFTNYYAHFFL